MSAANISPVTNPNQTYANLEIPPVAIILIGFACYIFILIIILIIRQLCQSHGLCDDFACDCCKTDETRCCDCCIDCTDACDCNTPTVDTCLDFCCPRRNLDCVGLILCDCCDAPDKSCCGSPEDPCCSCGDMNVNCACVQPEFNQINCFCCQIGSTNPPRNNDDD